MIGIRMIFVLLIGVPVSTAADVIMVGDIEIRPEDFSAKRSPEIRIAKCLACHGDRGGGDTDFGPDVHFGTPALRGMREAYLKESLVAYKAGARQHEEMSLVASLLDEETMEFMARTLAAMEVPPTRPAEELSALAETDSRFLEGQTIALQGVPQAGVPACTACHGALGEGSDLGPRLAGQNVMYIENQFRAFADGSRNTGQSAVMLPVVSGLTADELRAVAHYYFLLEETSNTQ